MKLAVKCQDEVFQVEVRPGDSGVEVELVDPAGRRTRSRVEVLAQQDDRWTLCLGNRIEDFLIYRQDGQTWVHWRGGNTLLEVSRYRRPSGRPKQRRRQGPTTLKAQMAGKVIQLLKGPGDHVAPGDSLIVLEAMKMQNELRAPQAGVVERVVVQEGDLVNPGQALIQIK